MLLALTKIVGWVFAHTPEFLLSALSQVLGTLVAHVHRPRRRVMLSSLKASFPERPDSWHRWVARQSCVRLIETSLLSLAAPFIPDSRIRKLATVSPEASATFAAYAASPRPILLGTTHLAYWEGLTWVRFLTGGAASLEIGAVFRPLRNPAMDAWLKQTRERFGVKLLSRKGGLHQGMHILKRNGAVGILFDQSAGSHGILTRFLGRECSTTPLPGMLVERSNADPFIYYAIRRAFWRFTIHMQPVATDGTEAGVTIALNRAFEELLRSDDNICASWLWLHQRWRILDRPGEYQKLVAKRGGLID